MRGATSIPWAIMFYEMLTGKVPFTGPNPFVIMNERLLNNPIPPREVNPEISPQLQEIIYRALERDPNKRYPNCHEFALDLQHPEKVGVADRAELTNWKQRRSPVAAANPVLHHAGLDSRGGFRFDVVSSRASK